MGTVSIIPGSHQEPMAKDFLARGYLLSNGRNWITAHPIPRRNVVKLSRLPEGYVNKRGPLQVDQIWDWFRRNT